MNTLLVVDTETGGLDPDRDSLLSLAAVVWREGELVADTEIFVCEPQPRITPESIAIHGIDPAWLQEHGLSPYQAVQELERFLRPHFTRFDKGDVQLAGHNVSFDVAFLKRLYRLAGLDYPSFYSHRLLDTAGLGLFFILAGYLPSGTANSDELFGYFKIPFGQNRRHSALGDAQATAELINAFLRMERNKAAHAGRRYAALRHLAVAIPPEPDVDGLVEDVLDHGGRPSELVERLLEESARVEYVVHLYFDPDEVAAELLEARHRGTPLGGRYSARRDPAHTPAGQVHLHLFAGNNEISAINLDGSAHDSSHGLRLPNRVADGIRKHFPKFRLPPNNIVESAPSSIQSVVVDQLTSLLI